MVNLSAEKGFQFYDPHPLPGVCCHHSGKFCGECPRVDLDVKEFDSIIPYGKWIYTPQYDLQAKPLAASG